jgi:hypothetical protein
MKKKNIKRGNRQTDKQTDREQQKKKHIIKKSEIEIYNLRNGLRQRKREKG